jgi:hypothetical protein
MTADAARVDQVDPQQPFVLPARIITALIQAAVLYGLNEAVLPKISWPATSPPLFDALLLIAVFTPLVVLVGLTKIRTLPLAFWAVIVTVVVGALGWYGAVRGGYVAFSHEAVRLPDFQLWVALIGMVFVGHVLFVDSILERSFMPPYPRRFDTAWKLCVQLLLSAAFVGVFWGVLWLGAALFKAINIDLFQRTITERWFAYPATTVAMAVSLHVTDVQPSLIRGARTLVLMLFSWLLPLLAAIMLAFLVSLPFMSLQVLWKTHFAGALMLTSGGLLILLINSCYQDGGAEQTTSRIKRIATMVAAIELVPVVALAAWALSLRVGQYGWSVERVFSAAITLVEACYALGYASAVIRAPVWMKRLEVVNFATAYVAITLAILLFSPIADPARTMVADQMARLKSGATKAGDFDYWALKANGAHWGPEALEKLSRAATGPDANLIKSKAKDALAAKFEYEIKATAKASDLAKKITVYPAGRTLPPDLAGADAISANTLGANCSEQIQGKCVARYLKLAPGQPESLVILTPFQAMLYSQDDKGRWHEQDLGPPGQVCDAARSAVATGSFELQPHDQPDIVAGGQRLTIMPDSAACPPLAEVPAPKVR